MLFKNKGEREKDRVIYLVSVAKLLIFLLYDNMSTPEFSMCRSLDEDLYLLVHNIDGPMLRNEKAQAVLASLAAHPKVIQSSSTVSRIYCM